MSIRPIFFAILAVGSLSTTGCTINTRPSHQPGPGAKPASQDARRPPPAAQHDERRDPKGKDGHRCGAPGDPKCAHD